MRTQKKKQDKLSDIDPAIALASGIIGFFLHRVAGNIKTTNKNVGENTKNIHGYQVGTLLTTAGLLSEKPFREIMLGLGLGMFADDVVWHFVPKEDYKVIPITTGETNKTPMADKYTQLIHIDENLPTSEKELQIFALFPRIIKEYQGDSDIRNAIEKLRQLLGLGNELLLRDMYKIQNFFLTRGHYTSEEGLWEGHDRYRLISKIMREFEQHGYFEYDCDCFTLSTCALLNYYHSDYHFVFISQKTDSKGYHPVHHVMPAVLSQNELMCVEGIRKLPIFNIRDIAMHYLSLKRVVIVDKDGVVLDYLSSDLLKRR